MRLIAKMPGILHVSNIRDEEHRRRGFLFSVASCVVMGGLFIFLIYYGLFDRSYNLGRSIAGR